jgi:predicted DNA-binding transcriptional regulator YafY
MGRRSGTETLVALVRAFLARSTWTQAELAREVGIGVPALRRLLDELVREGGVPLEREEEHPHVYWSVPKRWFPGGVFLSSDDAAAVLRQLARLPRTAVRDRLIQAIVKAEPRLTAPVHGELVTTSSGPNEEAFLPVIEDAITRRACLRLNYFSAHRGALEVRDVSPQRLAVGPPARLVGVCHRDDALKWFRVENVVGATITETVPFRSVAPEAVTEFLAESLGGFHGDAAVECTFFVRDPESRWVRLNLPEGTTCECVPGGVRVTATTTALLPLARYVVGLGPIARVETPALRALVAGLARGALGRCDMGAIGSVGSIEAGE